MHCVTNGKGVVGALLLVLAATGCEMKLDEQGRARLGEDQSGIGAVIDRDEALYRSELRETLCRGIASEVAADGADDTMRRCRNFQFTLTRTTKSASIRYATSNGMNGPGRLISLALDVTVTDPRGGQQWQRRLVRVVGAGWDLDWEDSARVTEIVPNAAIEDPLRVRVTEASRAPSDELNAMLCSGAEQADQGCSFTVVRTMTSALYLETVGGTAVPLELSMELRRNGSGERVRVLRRFNPELGLVWSARADGDVDFLKDLGAAFEQGHPAGDLVLANHLTAITPGELPEGITQALPDLVRDASEQVGTATVGAAPYAVHRGADAIGWVVPLTLGGEGTAHLVFDANEQLVGTFSSPAESFTH